LLTLVLSVAGLSPFPCHAQSAGLAVDHVFIVVQRGAPEAAVLREAGFRVTPDTTVHEGQGTASIAVLFDNAYLELLWVTDPDALRRADSALARFVLSGRSGAPALGLGLRLVDSLASLPFPTRSYRAAWMNPGTAIEFAATADGEPMTFVVPPYMALTAFTAGRPPLTSVLAHGTGSNAVTGVRFTRAEGGAPSEAFGWLLRSGTVHDDDAGSRMLVLELDGRRGGKVLDARPTLPLVIRY
jgi:hypothetical protein